MSEMMPILVVDDHPGNAKLIRFLLEKRGYDVRTVESADEAFVLLETFEAGIILTDLQMPGMDGFEFTRRLKADPKTAGIIVLAVTAYAMKGDEERALAAGCDGYITKPIDIHTLPRVLQEYVLRARGSTSSPGALPAERVR